MFSFFESKIMGWLEDLEAVSWNMEEQLATEEKADLLDELIQDSFRFRRDVWQWLGVLQSSSVGETPKVP